MDKPTVIRFLRIPDAGVVDYALSLANLTQRERMAVEMCLRLGMTQEAAAEKADVSVDAMKKWMADGLKKLETAWDGSWWIRKVTA